MLVLVGLYVRLTISETPVFLASVHREARVRVPMLVVLRDYTGTLVAGTLVSLATFVIFYLMTVFTLAWGTSALGFTREAFLRIQLVGVGCFAATIPISAALAERGRRRVLIGGDCRHRALRPGHGADLRRGNRRRDCRRSRSGSVSWV